MNIDKVLIFDLTGSLAHFRKFYTNSSSLSYTFPPRTALTGIIAAMLGIGRDKYYDSFSTANSKIALSVLTPLRKSIHTVNYLRVKENSDLAGKIGHTQIPLEIVFPLNGEIRYRIYFYHKDKALTENLEKHIEKPVFPLYFGLSEFIAKGEMVGYADAQETKTSSAVSINSVLNSKFVEDKGLVLSRSGKYLRYISEFMPLEFDKNRNLIKNAKFVYEMSHLPILAKIKTTHFVLSYGGREENILFMG